MQKLFLGFLCVAGISAILYMDFDMGRITGRAQGRAEEAQHRSDPSSYPKGSCAEQLAECVKLPYHYPRTTMTDPPELVCGSMVDTKLK